MTSSFGLKASIREHAGRSGGITRSSRSFLDYVVDGESLRTRLAASEQGASLVGDRVSVLALDLPVGFPAQDYGRLVGEWPAPLPGGRVPLYVCPECGDLACGAVTAVIEHGPDIVLWRDFGYQNDFDSFEPEDVLLDVGSIEFDRRDYLETFATFRDRWQDGRTPRASGQQR